VQETLAELAASLGIGRKIDFVLKPQELGPAIPADVAPLITEAWAHRPDLAAARNDRDAARRFAKAEGAARLPTVSAQGGAGVNPERVAGSLPNDYASVGVNVSVPIFTGGLLTARSREAVLRAQAAQKLLEDQETEAARDVYDAWYDAKTSFEAIAVTQQLLASSEQAFELAQARYQTGASSIVELSQADLQLVQAKIAAATSRYDYQVRRRALDFQMGILK
jgi:outer membrane protein